MAKPGDTPRAANAARLEKLLDRTLLMLDDGCTVTARAAVESGKIDGRYHREFSTRPDTYGVTVADEVGFYTVPKMIWDHLAHLPIRTP